MSAAPDSFESGFDRCLAAVRGALERYLVVWLTLLSAAAYFWKDWLPGVADPFAASKSSLDLIIAVTMLAIGSLLPREEIAMVARRWPTVVGGTAVQYLAMPTLAFVACWSLGLRGPMLLGVTMAGCVPGAMASNVLTMIARANVSYSVSLTTSATLLSPLVVPVALKLTLGWWQSFSAVDITLKLLWTVVLPVVVGHTLARFSPAWQRLAQRLGAIVANLTILWIIAVVVAVNRESLAQVGRLQGVGSLILALALLNLGGYAAGGLGGRAMRLPEGMRRALTLEVGMQNAGLGTMLILTSFPDQPEAAIPTALYTFGCMFTGTLLARYWARRGES